MVDAMNEKPGRALGNHPSIQVLQPEEEFPLRPPQVRRSLHLSNN
jgi:hypothetical protein